MARRWNLRLSPGIRPALRVARVDDPQRWDAIVCRLPHFALEQGWGWGEVLRASHALPYRCAVFDGEQCLGAAATLMWRLPALRSCVVYAPRGPLVDPEEPASAAALVNHLREIASAAGAVMVRASPAVSGRRPDIHDLLVHQGFTKLPEQWTIWNSPAIVMWSSLAGTEDDVWRQLSASRRREVRMAEAVGVEPAPPRSREDLLAFYRLIVTSGTRKKFPVRRLRHHTRLWSVYGSMETSTFFELARHRGAVIGGLVGVRFGGKAYLLYSAVERGEAGSGPAVTPGPLLYWRFMHWAKRQGCDSINWGGSATSLPPQESEPGFGLYQFKRSLGAEGLAYIGYYDLVLRPHLYLALRGLERRLGPALWRLRAALNR
jgi:lipid II:glycine glycyltransferase (peptidoglycan interpeptide bridge formation enzyme)